MTKNELVNQIDELMSYLNDVRYTTHDLAIIHHNDRITLIEEKCDDQKQLDMQQDLFDQYFKCHQSLSDCIVILDAVKNRIEHIQNDEYLP